MKRAKKTSAEIRRANRGNVPGVLGMEEMAMLTGRADIVSPAPPSEEHFCAQYEGIFPVQRAAKEIYRERYSKGMRTNWPSYVQLPAEIVQLLLSRWRKQP